MQTREAFGGRAVAARSRWGRASVRVLLAGSAPGATQPSASEGPRSVLREVDRFGWLRSVGWHVDPRSLPGLRRSDPHAVGALRPSGLVRLRQATSSQVLQYSLEVISGQVRVDSLPRTWLRVVPVDGLSGIGPLESWDKSTHSLEVATRAQRSMRRHGKRISAASFAYRA